MKRDEAPEYKIGSILLQLLPKGEHARPGLAETPERWCKAMRFWLSGYAEKPDTILKQFADGAEGYHDMVFQKDIPFYSMCEHHLATFFGVAHVAYIPNGKIVGLSKLARLVDVYARRLQVQERLGTQIADALVEHLNPVGVGVVLQARHMCMESRGVQKTGTITMTSSLRGAIRDEPDCRAEFMSLISSVQRSTL